MNTTENTPEALEPIELSYGETTMLKLEELFGDFYGPQRKAMPVGSDFWDWRKENKARANVLNKAGLVLNYTEDQHGRKNWTADLTNVSADSLDEARAGHIAWKRTEAELKDRANRYMRQCERAKYAPGGQFGGPA